MATAYGNVVKNWQAYAEATITSQTETTVTIQCKTYFHSRGYGYQVNGNGTATVDGQSANSGTVLCYSPTGGTVNQHLVSKSVTVSKRTSAYNVSCKAVVQLTGGFHNGTSTANLTVTVPALKSYTVSYNANGGSGAPGNQIKWYNQTLTLSNTRPSRTGHNFLHWSADFGSGAVIFNPGASYTRNSNANLYANWQAHTYTVSYNANGGSGAPGNQTKTYGQTLKLSSTIPTRKNYIFKGWGTSSGSTTVTYSAGANYTTNSSITLYAVWELAWIEPRITNFQASRCDSAGSLSETGKYAKVSFDWETDRAVSSITLECNNVTTDINSSGTSGSVSTVIGDNNLDVESKYTIKVTVTDSVGSAFRETVIAPLDYIMDIAPNGSVAFGKPADALNKRVEINKPTYISKPFNGLRDVGQHSNGARYKTLAKTNKVNNDNSNYGGIRITGTLGGYTSNHGPIDIFVPNRMASSTTVTVNILSPGVFNESASLMIILGNDNYVYVVMWATSYYYYNLRFEGENFTIVDSDWNTSRIEGTVLFDTNVINANQFGGYPTKLEYSNGFYGFALPDRTRAAYIRTTSEGIIPYKSGGSSQLGTEAWPFNEIWSNGYSSKASQLPYKHKHPSTNAQIEFGVGSSGTARGIYDRTNAKWVFHTNGTDCYVDGLRTCAKTVWSGTYFMIESQSITIPNINDQANGLVLTFSAYASGAGQNYEWQSFFIPKKAIIGNPGGGHLFIMASSNFPANFWFKYIYLSPTKITGHADNDRTGTSTSGVKVANNGCALRYVTVV